MKIRKFKVQDAEEVCDLIKRNNSEVTAKFYPKKVIEYWNDKLITPKYLLKRGENRSRFILEHNKKVIGYICFQKNVLKMLFVNPKFHKQSFGKALVKKVEEVIDKGGYEKIVAKSNLNSKEFFKKLGFKEKKIVYKSTGKVKIKKVLMEKKLK